MPGAAYYKIEIDFDNNFSKPPAIYDFATTANTFYTPKRFSGGYLTYYWRVIPYDGSGNPGKPSNAFSFQSILSSVAPHQVYPLYYYTPDAAGIATNPHEDRTVQFPIFMWHRTLLPAGAANAGDIYSSSYLLQVSTDATFDAVDWDLTTENNVATPYVGDDFTPLPDTDYFWRVCPLVEPCDEYSNWSQIWKTQFDPLNGLAPTSGASPTLIRPTNGFEFNEATPLLEWFPFDGATTYDVEISLDESFSSTVDTAQVTYPAYAPPNSLAQRSLGAVDFGVYYWHVKSSGSATWSETRRFQISASSQWIDARTLGDTLNRLQIGSDPAGEIDLTDIDYDLTSLQASQAENGWFFGFHVPTTPDTNVTYALYLDLDHAVDSGGTSDPMGYSVTTLPAYLPEYVIYIFQEAGAFSATRTRLYQWQGTSWGSPQSLYSIGGSLSFSGDYVEIKVLNTAINYGENAGSYTLNLLSLPYGVSGVPPEDSVPSVTNIPGGGQVNRFANVTERMNLLTPPNNAGVDPSEYPSILPFFWDFNILAPDAGARAKIWLDQEYTSEVTYNLYQTDTHHWSQSSHAWESDFNGDNTYYWRIQPDYDESLTTTLYGVWSQGYRFERKGFVPENLQTSVDFATPTFSWDMVEGTQFYDLQVSTDPGFGGTPVINVSTRLNSYTYTDHTLAEATYYWRVRVHRYAPTGTGVDNAWTTPTEPCPPTPSVDDGCFTLTLPAPTGLTPTTTEPPFRVWQAPTFCWSPLIINSPLGDPVLAAWKYKVEYSRNSGFSAAVAVDTEQSCWTPKIGLADGMIYWHVAMIDGEGKIGSYSPAESLRKEYPRTTLISPIEGEPITTTPTFIWEPVAGAAKYRIQTSLSEFFGTTIDAVDTHNTQYTPTTVYNVDIQYYWRVAIIDDDGILGPYTDAIYIDPYALHFYLPFVRRP